MPQTQNLLKQLRTALLSCEPAHGSEHALHEAEHAAIKLSEQLEHESAQAEAFRLALNSSYGRPSWLGNLLPGEEVIIRAEGSTYTLHQNGLLLATRACSGSPKLALPRLAALVADLSAERAVAAEDKRCETYCFPSTMSGYVRQRDTIPSPEPAASTLECSCRECVYSASPIEREPCRGCLYHPGHPNFIRKAVP